MTHDSSSVLSLRCWIVAGVLAIAYGAAWKWESEAKEHEITFIVPPGTAVLQANGKDDLMLPKQIWLVAGEYDTLIISTSTHFQFALAHSSWKPASNTGRLSQRRRSATGVHHDVSRRADEDRGDGNERPTAQGVQCVVEAKLGHVSTGTLFCSHCADVAHCCVHRLCTAARESGLQHRWPHRRIAARRLSLVDGGLGNTVDRRRCVVDVPPFQKINREAMRRWGG